MQNAATNRRHSAARSSACAQRARRCRRRRARRRSRRARPRRPGADEPRRAPDPSDTRARCAAVADAARQHAGLAQQRLLDRCRRRRRTRSRRAAQVRAADATASAARLPAGEACLLVRVVEQRRADSARASGGAPVSAGAMARPQGDNRGGHASCLLAALAQSAQRLEPAFALRVLHAFDHGARGCGGIGSDADEAEDVAFQRFDAVGAKVPTGR